MLLSGQPAVASLSEESANLDQLRALAVLLVFADHLFETTASMGGVKVHPFDYHMGRIGVLLFFVHTSLVLMRSMRRMAAAGQPLFLPFYVRRAFRIYPLAICCVVLTQVIGIPIRPTGEGFMAADPITFVSNLLLTTNLTHSNVVLSPLWSLPVEVQMYVLLPFIFVAINRWSAVSTTAALWAATIVVGTIQPFVSERLSLLFYTPCFMAGTVAYVLADRITPRLPGSTWIGSLFVLMAVYIAGASMLGDDVHYAPTQWLLCLAVGASIPLFRECTWTRVNAGAKVIARYSYSIYLFHVIAVWIAFRGLALQSLALQLATTFVLLTPLCIAGYHAIEAPCIKAGVSIAKRLNRLTATKLSQYSMRSEQA